MSDQTYEIKYVPPGESQGYLDGFSDGYARAWQECWDLWIDKVADAKKEIEKSQKEQPSAVSEKEK
jgi:hypothetical protein